MRQRAHHRADPRAEHRQQNAPRNGSFQKWRIAEADRTERSPLAPANEEKQQGHTKPDERFAGHEAIRQRRSSRRDGHAQRREKQAAEPASQQDAEERNA